jgi:hypothetical protein
MAQGVGTGRREPIATSYMTKGRYMNARTRVQKSKDQQLLAYQEISVQTHQRGFEDLLRFPFVQGSCFSCIIVAISFF